MKKILAILLAVPLFVDCSVLRLNPVMLGQAAGSALTAVAITDEQIVELSKSAVAEMDSKNILADASYQERLAGLLSGIEEVEGVKINYKVYKKQEINAFACGDGSIRVYSGLMDVMKDNEVMAIIGHECGHVVHQDTKKAMKNAYLSQAARYALGSSNGVIGAISRSVAGALGEAFVDSRFSQKQEYRADEYGFKFSTEHGYSPYSMADALTRLVELAGGSQASLVQKMFSSHPDSAGRAEKMRKKAELYSGLHAQ